MIGNDHLSRTFRIEGSLKTEQFENRMTGERWPVRSEEFVFGTEDAWMRASDFSVDDVQEEKEEVRLTFQLVHGSEKARARIVFELGRQAHYLRKRVAFFSEGIWQGEWLSDVVVEDIHYG